MKKTPGFILLFVLVVVACQKETSIANHPIPTGFNYPELMNISDTAYELIKQTCNENWDLII